ncbi:hypothetical protein QJS66_17795 [Kocuria rhizophila]|nr:hypothetical protein QJS66_17795 [Kocuria rhizophila]
MRLAGPDDQWSLPDSRGTAHIEFTAVDLYDGRTSRSQDVPSRSPRV